MIVAIDTNIVVDVLIGDQQFANKSKQLLAQAYDSGALVICDLVYAELAPQFSSSEELDSVLHTLGIRIVENGADVAWLAGKKWAQYRASGGTRERMLADFVIGAHAIIHADRFLTRDRGFYRSYFPELVLMGRE